MLGFAIIEQKQNLVCSYFYLFILFFSGKNQDSVPPRKMLGCGAHVRIITLSHVRLSCGSACGKGLELCVRKCVGMGNFRRAICDCTFLPVRCLCIGTYFRSS